MCSLRIECEEGNSLTLEEKRELTSTMKIIAWNWLDIEVEINKEQAQQIIEHLKTQFNIK